MLAGVTEGCQLSNYEGRLADIFAGPAMTTCKVQSYHQFIKVNLASFYLISVTATAEQLRTYIAYCMSIHLDSTCCSLIFPP